jgi:Protein of unknown function (DUF2971)
MSGNVRLQMNKFQVLDFEQQPTPPTYLYKYLVAERLDDVLKTGTVRFTQLMNTNDLFEVRRTFRKFAGPRFMRFMSAMLEEKLRIESLDERIAAKLREIGAAGKPIRQVKRMFKKLHGQTIEEYFRAGMDDSIGLLASHLNDETTIADFLTGYAQDLFCFSVSATWQSAPMWAHYAGNNSGFVIRYDTAHEWFQQRIDRTSTRLQKVAYLDAELEEALDNVQGVFISKSSDWSYEQEWRLYCGKDHIEKTVGSPVDPIHLIGFPRDAVSAVIIGSKASQETAARAREILAAQYPKANLLVAKPIPLGSSYSLEEI